MFWKKKSPRWPSYIEDVQQLLEQSRDGKIPMSENMVLYDDGNTTILFSPVPLQWVVHIEDANSELWMLDPIYRVLEDDAYTKLMTGLANKSSDPTNQKYKMITASNPQNGMSVMIKDHSGKPTGMEIIIPLVSQRLVDQFTAVENIYNILRNNTHHETEFAEWCQEKLAPLAQAGRNV